jgi:hypothetical protein
MVATMRADVSGDDTTIERWQNEITHIFGVSKVGKNLSGKYKRQKDRLLIIISNAVRSLLSPMLFNLVVHMLAILTARTEEDSQVRGLIPDLVEGGASILQYIDYCGT